MKKLNNKGFTLIELLAIIVILAIIMVVTIPTVLSSMGTAREEMFQTSANTVADWVEKQYTYAMMQEGEEAFTGVCTATATANTNGGNYCAMQYTATTIGTNDAKFLRAAGVDPNNYSGMTVLVESGRACVTLTASADGDFDAYKSQTKSSTGCN